MISLLDRLIFLGRGLWNIRFVLKFSHNARKSIYASLVFVGRFVELRQECDVIHVHHLQNLTPDHLAFISLLKRPTVISLRGSDALISPLVDEASMTSLKRVLEFADCIHVVSEHLAKTIIRYGAKEGKIHIIRRTPESLVRISSRPSFEEGIVNLTTIGRYNWVKGYPFLLQAVRILVDEGYDVKLRIVGDGPKEQLYEIIYWINFLRLDSAVILCGYKTSEEIDHILEETHVYVQPSISEGIPNTLTRALFNRIPIVASKVGGIPEVMTEDCGILVPPGDSMALAKAIKKIISDSTYRNSLYQTPSEVFVDKRTEVEKYSNLYYRAIVAYREKRL